MCVGAFGVYVQAQDAQLLSLGDRLVINFYMYTGVRGHAGSWRREYEKLGFVGGAGETGLLRKL